MSSNRKEIAKKFTYSIYKLTLWIAAYIIISALINGYVFKLLAEHNLNVSSYSSYINIPLAILFGYLIVASLSDVIYWNLRFKYDHSAAAGARNAIKIIGIGAILSSIAGGVAGGTAGVALGGFLGLVVGYASQQVLGQAISGLFLLTIRPFKIGDKVNIVGEDGEVLDIGVMFILLKKSDNTLVYIPNNSVISQKIYKKEIASS
ncbi:mechanosensitive ion channel domain-containing protein [Fervidicoccus fontis]|uniref:Small-conductance mechanosensitive channel-like protein n=1 Tax=Fervidicoccus fontis (strain DSM 19380 / JCM 18336 / VKM B-2539 / Kam940) TaxID=1163730 RepID=H9ZZX1_FERFK|nr:mechanosensitive ion channel domain-containing protein [Fervidicoccus fontis]AFH42278.1 Small-conductance mechanosensitive channel-like protein [Fervidicoccus fontis Kam940]